MMSSTRNSLEDSPLSSSGSDTQFQRDLISLIPFLNKYSRKLCRNRDIAEDMMQETLAKAWRARDRFQLGTNLKAWIFTILRNEFHSYLRHARHEAQWDDELGENIPAPNGKQERTMDLSDTARALGELREDQRDALILVGAGGFTCEEAARLRGTAMGTIKSRVGRAREHLLKYVDGQTPLPRRPAARATEAMENILAQLSALSSATTNNTPMRHV
jgi:RNA polymerase sigma factor (sigma-70 family)